MTQGPVLVLQSVALRTGRGPLRVIWALAYSAIMRMAAAYLVIGTRGATVYVRGSLASGDQVYGLSDIDLAVVVAHDADVPGRARDRLTRRWTRLSRLVPMTRKLVQVGIYEEADLKEAIRSSALTADRPTQLVSDFADQAGLRVRPGLYGPMTEWRLLRGTEWRPTAEATDAQELRIATWLELQFWWRCAFSACLDPTAPHVPYLCVKLIAVPARILLWILHREKVTGLRNVLERALSFMPEEEEALLLALELDRRLTASPTAPLGATLPAFVRLSSRIANELLSEIETQGTTTVRLAWNPEAELAVAPCASDSLRPFLGSDSVPCLLPLADWRARAWPLLPDETFALVPLEPSDPSALAAASTAARAGPYPALEADNLLVLPATRGGVLRAVQCPATDPVSFALVGGRATAQFPNVPGWSIQDSARRAVLEHRAWLGRGDRSRAPSLPALGRLVTAARAALLEQSIETGEPELALTTAAVAERLGAWDADASAVAADVLASYRHSRTKARAPRPRDCNALRELVLRLPAYSPNRGL